MPALCPARFGLVGPQRHAKQMSYNYLKIKRLIKKKPTIITKCLIFFKKSSLFSGTSYSSEERRGMHH